MGDGRDVEPKDIERGLELYDRALVLLLTLAVVLAVVL
jgi:cobalamin biosynthesis protein CobD/CbiB